VLKEVGAVTILIQNAGIIVTKETLEHTENEIRKLYDVNVLAHYWLFQAFLPKMIENGRGHIVGICSMGGLFAVRNIVPYCSSKFAVRGLMEGLANEVYTHTKGKVRFFGNFKMQLFNFSNFPRLNSQQFILSTSTRDYLMKNSLKFVTIS
jgi:all-trans-retinol dehydrogenase (NAD+)